MIDIHTHFLPGIDDGAKDLQEGIDMLTDAYRQGVRVCVATPHCQLHADENLDAFLAERDASYQALCAEIKINKSSVPRILLGAEVYLDNDINHYKDIEKLCFTGTNALLLEFSGEQRHLRYAEWLYELSMKGIRPVIAHIDRYPFGERLMNELEGIDIVYQINAARFLSLSGRSQLSRLLKHKCTYIVSSDMHNTRSRTCNMEAAYRKALQKYAHTADVLFSINAKKMLYQSKGWEKQL